MRRTAAESVPEAETPAAETPAAETPADTSGVTAANDTVYALDTVNIRSEANESGSVVGRATGLGSQIELNAATGIIEARSNGSTSAVSYMSPSGIFANRAGTRCVAASSGLDQRAAICGLGYGNLNKTEWETGESTLLAAVYGYASNSGTAVFKFFFHILSL